GIADTGNLRIVHLIGSFLPKWVLQPLLSKPSIPPTFDRASLFCGSRNRATGSGHTTRANRRIEPIHRMPVILDERTAEDRMNRGVRDPWRLKSLPVPAPDSKLVLSPASSLVNSMKNDGPELLVPDRNVPVQRSLF